MELAALLDEAESASAQTRIEWRDRIAAFGPRAIDGVRPWLASPTLAAFAIRVTQRVGEGGEAALAARVLRSARREIPAHLQDDIEWALARLKAAAQPAAPEVPESLPVTRPPVVRPPAVGVRGRRPRRS